MDLPRAAGVQLHLTSLPEGRLGPSAYAFVDWLVAAGQSVWQMLPLGPPDKYGSPYKAQSAFAAWEGLLAEPDAPVSDAEITAFRERNAYWARSWPDLAPQVRFEREWTALRTYANDRGVRLMGDVPIYVAPGSADDTTWPRFFRSDAVSGVPPDAYAKTGQLWGNPLYDWEALAADGYRWWIERFRRTFAQFDLVRVDHFRAFSAFWEVPVGAETAMDGRWVDGPGAAVFAAAAAELGDLRVVAEDLGDIDQPVIDLRDALGFPGMAVLQFAFDPEDTEHGIHEPANLVEHQVVYTGTHDSDTVVGWWSGLEAPRRANALAAFTDPDEPVHWAMIRLAWNAPSRLAMTQVQDILGLGSEGRMNVPGTQGRSWKWRLELGALTADHAARLRELTRACGR
jgi:4-alpha-glucanotransferase